MKVGINYDVREDYLANGFCEEEAAEFDRAGTIEAIGPGRSKGWDTKQTELAVFKIG